nr:unnamed protein product [Spirometra erinaceieuropaei]
MATYCLFSVLSDAIRCNEQYRSCHSEVIRQTAIEWFHGTRDRYGGRAKRRRVADMGSLEHSTSSFELSQTISEDTEPAVDENFRQHNDAVTPIMPHRDVAHTPTSSILILLLLLLILHQECQPLLLLLILILMPPQNHHSLLHIGGREAENLAPNPPPPTPPLPTSRLGSRPQHLLHSRPTTAKQPSRSSTRSRSRSRSRSRRRSRIRLPRPVIEIWSSGNISDSEIALPGYKIYRRDREHRHGGGIVVYVNEGLAVSENTTKFACSKEAIWLTIKVTGSPCLDILTVYRPPRTAQTAGTQISEQLEKFSSRPNIMIMGDVNAPGTNWNTLQA